MKLRPFAIVLFALALSAAADEIDGEVESDADASTVAPVTTSNPQNVSYEATLLADNPVQGNVIGVSGANGTGVDVAVNLTSFPADAGPFEYHIHEYAVPSNGSCNATGEHLDPYNATEATTCNPLRPATCQVGDLSGKHGKILDAVVTSSFMSYYSDAYLSTDPDDPAFFGNRSLVVHAANGTRLNCGNFVLAAAASSSSSSSSGSEGTNGNASADGGSSGASTGTDTATSTGGSSTSGSSATEGSSSTSATDSSGSGSASATTGKGGSSTASSGASTTTDGSSSSTETGTSGTSTASGTSTDTKTSSTGSSTSTSTGAAVPPHVGVKLALAMGALHAVFAL